MKQKTIDCLVLSTLSLATKERKEMFLSLIQQYSQKAVLRKLQELLRRGYIETIEGNVITSSITPIGKTVLENATRPTEISA